MSETSPFTHLTERGEAHMVDITAKTPTVRQARARGFVECSPKIMAALRDDSVPKGDALAVARIAGIQASKRTPELLPLAHDMVKGIDKLVAIRECYVEEKSGGRSGTWTRPSA